jgi:hypothetical protein
MARQAAEQARAAASQGIHDVTTPEVKAQMREAAATTGSGLREAAGAAGRGLVTAVEKIDPGIWPTSSSKRPRSRRRRTARCGSRPPPTASVRSRSPPPFRRRSASQSFALATQRRTRPARSSPRATWSRVWRRPTRRSCPYRARSSQSSRIGSAGRHFVLVPTRLVLSRVSRSATRSGDRTHARGSRPPGPIPGLQRLSTTPIGE